MSSVNDIRSGFLNYFAENGHQIVDSSPLVPQNDPTLMFANSGMVQFKNLFTGAETRDYTRATTSQKCVRAGGKHNDLENVGYTARHHTFFEMLGNFSFGDYFKERAIELAWRLITTEFGLDPQKLLVTVYHEDDDAAALWRKIAGLGDDRIIRIATSDNFWAMGDTGPCGPCSEIFYDHGAHIAGGPPGSPDEDGDRFIEIWNLVLMQYEQTAAERLSLPKPSIDTGMGLERIAAVLQGKHDNYDIDLMRSLIMASAEASGTDADGAHNVSHRVVADHLRAASFLIADGVLPSNEGRGYVLRRIMRRAIYVAGLPVRMMRVGFVGELGFELHAPSPLIGELWDQLMTAGEAHGIRPFGVEAQRLLRLEKGHLIVGQDTDGMTHPDEVALRWAVAQKKAFFVGNKSVDILSKHPLTRQLVGFELGASSPQPKEGHLVIHDGNIVGSVTSCEYSPTMNKIIGLAYVHPSDSAVGSTIIIRTDNDIHVRPVVVTTPFYDPNNARQTL